MDCKLDSITKTPSHSIIIEDYYTASVIGTNGTSVEFYAELNTRGTHYEQNLEDLNEWSFRIGVKLSEEEKCKKDQESKKQTKKKSNESDDNNAKELFQFLYGTNDDDKLALVAYFEKLAETLGFKHLKPVELFDAIFNSSVMGLDYNSELSFERVSEEIHLLFAKNAGNCKNFKCDKKYSFKVQKKFVKIIE